MKRVKLVVTALALAAVATLTSGVAAQQTNVSERTFLTFSSAVEMPGVTLQPGTYVFKLADTASRNVVQVWDNDEKNMLGQWLFVQSERPEVTEETVVTFRETREGATPAVQFWYFPGERIGKEFIYPRVQAERIAARTGQPVRTEDGIIEGAGLAVADAAGDAAGAAGNAVGAAADVAEDVVDNTTGAVAAAGQAVAGVFTGSEAQAQTVDDQAGVTASADVNAQGGQGAVSADADIDADRSVGTAGQAEGQVARANELPRTASPLALSGLLGLLSLAGAAGIRAIRK